MPANPRELNSNGPWRTDMRSPSKKIPSVLILAMIVGAIYLAFWALAK